MGLVRLWLEACAQRGGLQGGVRMVELRVTGLRTTPEALALFAHKPKRDREAAARALARLRASFGAQAVVHAQLRPGHLPEARFAWQPMDSVPDVRPRVGAAQETQAANATINRRPLMRRLYAPAQALPLRPQHEPDGWLVRGVVHGPVDRVTGPHMLSGGWWNAHEIERDYYFVKPRAGGWLWVYYDKRRRRWFLQAEIA